ncbi:hypothetical protein CPB85DRAFT_1220060, partial [Mucidula mucida]
IAAKTLAETVPRHNPVRCVSDSRHVLDGLLGRFTKWEDEGYFLISNSLVTQTMIARFRERTAETHLEWVKGHSGDHGNDGADKLAGEASRRQEPDIVDLTIPPELKVRGAKLKALTQATAYKMIRKLKMQSDTYQEKLDRRGTAKNVTLALEAAAGRCDAEVSSEQLWLSVRRKDFSRSVKYFLWMLIHDGYNVGRHWKHIPGYEARVQCQECGDIESMEHILTQCDVPGQREVWDLVSQMWTRKTGRPLQVNIGDIISCGIQPPNMSRKATTRGEERMRRILISESAHLIWKLRNERVINEKPPSSRREIENRFRYTINRRLELDCLLSDKKRFGKKAISKSLVLNTWRDVIPNDDDRTRESGVLVGIDT